MTNLQPRKNVGFAQRFRDTFKPRDIFLHDGRSLRRYRIGTRLQVGVSTVAAAFIGWCGYATVHYAVAQTGEAATMQARVAEMEQDVAEIRAASDERAAVLEQRQRFLAAMMSDASPDQVARLLPASASAPGNEAEQTASESFSDVDGMQLMLADQANQQTRQRIDRTAAAVRSLGLDPQRLMQRYAGVGGPDGDDDIDPRFAQLFASWRQLDSLEQGVASIPSALPIPVNLARFTSGFGTRSDPFHGRAARHAGIDLAGPIGTPIYAAADATVGRAGVSGGYGNLIELDHGAGIGTRYGHLSRIMVQPGERVRRGQLIGLMGSTGRSTGSHLHYEVRIDGQAVNPLPFLQTGQAMAQRQGQQGGGQGASR